MDCKNVETHWKCNMYKWNTCLTQKLLSWIWHTLINLLFITGCVHYSSQSGLSVEDKELMQLLFQNPSQDPLRPQNKFLNSLLSNAFPSRAWMCNLMGPPQFRAPRKGITATEARRQGLGEQMRKSVQGRTLFWHGADGAQRCHHSWEHLAL